MEKMKTFTTLYKESFTLYKNNFKFLTIIMLISNFIGMLLRGISRGFAPQISTVFYSQSANIAVFVSIFAVSWFLIILGNIATLVAIKNIKQERETEIVDVYRQSIKLFLPVLMVFIIQILIIMGGYLILIAPGIIFSIWYMFSFYSAVLHNKRKTEALALSKSVVRTSMGRVIGYSLLAGILIYGPYVIIYYVVDKYLIHYIYPYLAGIFVGGIIDSILTVWMLAFSSIFYLDIVKSNPKIFESFELESIEI